MRMIRISRHRMPEEYERPFDQFEIELEEDGISSEEEAFIRGWEGNT